MIASVGNGRLPDGGLARDGIAQRTPDSFTQRYTGGAYLEQVADWHAGDAQWKAGKVSALIERHGLVPGSVCDVGCGAGEVLAHLRAGMPADCRFSGFDISPQAIGLAKAKEARNLSFHLLDFARETQEAFDLVLLLDVFEHVPDYLSFLKEIRSRGSRFIFHIPLDVHAQSVLRRSRYMLEMRKAYGHLHYFTSETALATLEDTGYSVVDSSYTWDHEDLPLGLRESFRYPWRWGVRMLDRALFALEPALAARLRPHFNMLVLATPRRDGE